MMNPEQLLKKYFPDPNALAIIYQHSRLVADKAVKTGLQQGLAAAELIFVEEAALLHDIGVCRTASAKLHCYGREPYLMHGIIGREILEAEGLPRHAMVCERHIGVGLTTADIDIQRLPLPHRDMTPITLEEQIICYADLFYSKKSGQLQQEKSVAQVRASLQRFGSAKVEIFDKWHKLFQVEK